LKLSTTDDDIGSEEELGKLKRLVFGRVVPAFKRELDGSVEALFDGDGGDFRGDGGFLGGQFG
jgi:hypothetical protein